MIERKNERKKSWGEGNKEKTNHDELFEFLVWENGLRKVIGEIMVTGRAKEDAL